MVDGGWRGKDLSSGNEPLPLDTPTWYAGSSPQRFFAAFSSSGMPLSDVSKKMVKAGLAAPSSSHSVDALIVPSEPTKMPHQSKISPK